MSIIIQLLTGAIIVGLLTVIAFLQTELNITKSKLEDLEFLYDLRK